MSGRPRRVPPPPPPGFGDDEYYRLYGKPEEYHRYRADLESRAEQEDYYYNYGSRYSHYAGGPRERKRRIAPPPPPGFEDSPPVRKRIAPPPPDSFSSGSEEDSGPPVFRNIKVTIKNESDGTPSLSESEEDRRPARKKKRRSEKEKRRRLERKLAEREEELKLLSEQQRGVKTNQPKKSIKERLGVRKEDLPSVKSSVTPRKSLAHSSSENIRRDDLLRRAEIRRQNQEKSPIPYQGKQGITTRSRSRRRQSPSRSRDRGKTTEGGSKPLDRRRRKRRRRKRERGRGIKQMSLKEENEEMKAKLLDRGATRAKSGARVDARLARLAGSESQSDSETAGSDSETDSDHHSGSSRSQRSRITGKMRSDEVKVETRPGAGKTGDGDKWKHDKFSEAAGEEEEQGEDNFSKHWRSRNRRDRSDNKTAGRLRSTSSRSGSRRRSRSRRTRSRSSRSKSRRKSKKTRRRGKFSRSRSRSSSSSSSRSRSLSRRRSSSSSRSRSRRRSRSGSSDSVIPRGSESKIKKEGVDLGLSGNLAADTNTVNGCLVKYSEPAEAKKPKKKWRLYVFKGSEELPILYIHRQSAYLLGRDRKVADIPLDHPSCSKQHSVLQYRLVPITRQDGTTAKRVQLYVMDLGSANGTFVNNKKIESQKYIQLLEKDVLKFGFSSREYVLLHDQSKEDEEDLGVD